jgi:hypothetical protein
MRTGIQEHKTQAAAVEMLYSGQRIKEGKAQIMELKFIYIIKTGAHGSVVG